MQTSKSVVRPNYKFKTELDELDLEEDRSNEARKGTNALLGADDIERSDNNILLAELVCKNFRGTDLLYTLKFASGIEIVAFNEWAGAPSFDTLASAG